MDICLYGISALEALRAIDGLPSFSRTSLTEGCVVPHHDEVLRRTSVFGGLSSPVHVMVSSDRERHDMPGVVRHVVSAPLPARSLMWMATGVLVPVPELCFIELACQLAQKSSSVSETTAPWRQGDEPSSGGVDPAYGDGEPFVRRLKSEVDLLKIGFELAGTYRMGMMTFGEMRTGSGQLMSLARLSALLDELGGQVRGTRLARRALATLREGSRSPMETALALMLCAPPRLGGMGLRGGELNWQVRTSAGTRFVDLGFPEAGVGLEYQGEAYHRLEQVKRDGRRVNALAGSKLTIFNVWREDLARPQLFEALVRDVTRCMGHRVRIRTSEFRYRQALLRARVLPPVARKQ